jgi:lipopolysaccharide transport protein LptA
LDARLLLVGLWLAGVAGAALIMAVLQHRFVVRARQGGVGPAVVGLLAPRIVTPSDFAQRYSPSEQALVLAHEQAHLARQDSRLNGLLAALQCLGWFNPLVHLAARLMRIDQELACDEAVVNRFPDARRAYAEVLMKAQLAVLPLPLGCYWPSRSQHPLVERVAMLKRPRIGRGRGRAGAVVLACLWAGAGVAAWASQPVQVRTVLRGAPAAEGPSEVFRSDAMTADAAPDAVVRSPAVRSAAAPDRPAPSVLAQASPPPQPIMIDPRMTRIMIEHVVIKGAERIDQAAILSKVGIRPGDVVTVETLDAAEAALVNTGLFSDVSVRSPRLGGSGDLVVWVTENPLVDQVKFEGNANLKDDQLRAVMQERPDGVFSRAKLTSDQDSLVGLYRQAGWPNAKVSFKTSLLPENRIDVTFVVDEGAKSQGGNASGPISVVAGRVNSDEDHHRVEFAGNVEFQQGGWRVTSDLADVQSYAPDEPGRRGDGVKEAKWQGHVLVDTGDETARADRAVYEPASKTITLSGHVAVERGQGAVKNDRLVIAVKD